MYLQRAPLSPLFTLMQVMLLRRPNSTPGEHANGGVALLGEGGGNYNTQKRKRWAKAARQGLCCLFLLDFKMSLFGFFGGFFLLVCLFFIKKRWTQENGAMLAHYAPTGTDWTL